MPIVYLVVGLLVVGLYFYLCALFVCYVAVPGMVFGLGTGAAAGVLVGLVLVCLALLGEQTARVRTPSDVAAGKLRILRTPTAVRPDFAWPGYFVSQVWLDWRVVAGRSGAVLGSVWSWFWGLVRPAWPVALVCWPLLLPVLVTLGGLSAAVVVMAVLLLVVLGAATAAAWALATPVAAGLRVVDRAGQGLRRSAGNCPRCYQVSARPVFRCPGPHPDAGSALHHDVRPGLLGLLNRRCGCGRRLPTTVLRAARSMVALCPLCGADLHSGAGAATDVRVPVFGAPSSGKTHLVMAGVVGLLRRGGDVEVTLADEHSERTYRTYAEVIDSGGSAVKTDAAGQPIALTLRLRHGRRDALVHVYDAAGEALGDRELNEKFQYLDAARTLVFVLDPFAVPEIRQRYQRSFAELFRDANVSADAPEPSYQNIVTRLRQHGVRTEQKRLAFVVSKQDLIRRLPGTDELINDSAAVRSWLTGHGADNLVFSAERDFKAVRYFLVSARSASTGGDGPLEPFLWLLGDEPVPRQAPASTSALQHHRA